MNDNLKEKLKYKTEDTTAKGSEAKPSEQKTAVYRRNPFSARYFVRENGSRCLLLILMFVFTYIIYIGGLYVTNIGEFFNYSINNLRYFAVFDPDESDYEWKDFENAMNEIAEDSRVTVIQMGVRSYLYTKAIMGFNNDYPQYTFQSVEDFKVFCDFMGIKCDFTRLKDGSLIASRLFAANRGMKIGDKPIEQKGESIYGDLTLDAITNEKGYTAYYINSNGLNMRYIVMATGMTKEEFDAWKKEITRKYHIKLSMDDEILQNQISRQLAGLNYIYLFIVMLMAVVIAVTINAAFVGMYQHRQPEFAIYRAIGIKKGKIIKKVAGELVTIDAIGMVTGGGLTMLLLYLLNNLYLVKHGLRLFYYNEIAMAGMVVCNVMVIVPLIFIRCKKILKADICEY